MPWRSRAWLLPPAVQLSGPRDVLSRGAFRRAWPGHSQPPDGNQRFHRSVPRRRSAAPPPPPPLARLFIPSIAALFPTATHPPLRLAYDCTRPGDALDKGGRVLVHCTLGVSRSTTSVAAFLIRYKKWTLKETLDFLADKRQGIKCVWTRPLVAAARCMALCAGSTPLLAPLQTQSRFSQAAWEMGGARPWRGENRRGRHFLVARRGCCPATRLAMPQDKLSIQIWDLSRLVLYLSASSAGARACRSRSCLPAAICRAAMACHTCPWLIFSTTALPVHRFYHLCAALACAARPQRHACFSGPWRLRRGLGRGYSQGCAGL